MGPGPDGGADAGGGAHPAVGLLQPAGARLHQRAEGRLQVGPGRQRLLQGLPPFLGGDVGLGREVPEQVQRFRLLQGLYRAGGAGRGSRRCGPLRPGGGLPLRGVRRPRLLPAGTAAGAGGGRCGGGRRRFAPRRSGGRGRGGRGSGRPPGGSGPGPPRRGGDVPGQLRGSAGRGASQSRPATPRPPPPGAGGRAPVRGARSGCAGARRRPLPGGRMRPGAGRR